jgi:hypothetical protein
MKIAKISKKQDGMEVMDFYRPVLLVSSKHSGKTYLNAQFEKYTFELLQALCVVIGLNPGTDTASPVETSKKMFSIEFAQAVNYARVMTKLVDITHDPECKRFIVFWLAPKGGAVSQKFTLDGQGYEQARDAFGRIYDLVSAFQDDTPVLISNNSSLLF